jgi:hypothetical protein
VYMNTKKSKVGGYGCCKMFREKITRSPTGSLTGEEERRLKARNRGEGGMSEGKNTMKAATREIVEKQERMNTSKEKDPRTRQKNKTEEQEKNKTEEQDRRTRTKNKTENQERITGPNNRTE